MARTRRARPSRRKRPRPRPPFQAKSDISVILCKLTDAEYEAFYSAKLPLSGATGKGATQGYGEYGPYIATSFEVLPKALAALGWTKVLLRTHTKQWIVQRERRAGR